MRRHADLVVTATVAVLACVSVALSAPVAVAAVLGLALLAAPGYLFGELLFGSRIAGLERVAVFIGLALCVPILGGLLLFATGAPVHRPAWLALLAGATGVGDLALLWQRHRGGRAGAFAWPAAVTRPPIRHVVTVGVAVVIAVGALGLARAGAAIQHNPGFTQLWLAHPGHAATANLGVGNHEGTTTRYRLVLLRNGRSAVTWNITLANGQTWQRSPVVSGHGTVTVNLYRLPDLVHPYRHVALDDGAGPGS